MKNKLKFIPFQVVFFGLSTVFFSCQKNEIIPQNEKNPNASSLFAIPPDEEVCIYPVYELRINNRNLTEGTFAFNGSIFYSIRDSFLINYPKGNQLIEDYYYISDILLEEIDNVPDATLLEMTVIAPDVYSAYNNLMNENYSGTIVDEELADDLIDIVDSLSGLSTDTGFGAKMSSLKTDLESIKNKNRSEIISILQ